MPPESLAPVPVTINPPEVPVLFRRMPLVAPLVLRLWSVKSAASIVVPSILIPRPLVVSIVLVPLAETVPPPVAFKPAPVVVSISMLLKVKVPPTFPVRSMPTLVVVSTLALPKLNVAEELAMSMPLPPEAVVSVVMLVKVRVPPETLVISMPSLVPPVLLAMTLAKIILLPLIAVLFISMAVFPVEIILLALLVTPRDPDALARKPMSDVVMVNSPKSKVPELVSRLIPGEVPAVTTMLSMDPDSVELLILTPVPDWV